MLKAKCKNNPNCLKAKYDITISIVDETNLLCPDCNQELVILPPTVLVRIFKKMEGYFERILNFLFFKYKKQSIPILAILAILLIFYIVYVPPIQFSTTPLKQINQDKEYVYKYSVKNNKGDYRVEVTDLPEWLSWSKEDSIISGIPTYEHIGDYRIVISASDAELDTSVQEYKLKVIDVNDLPQLINFDAVAFIDSSFSFIPKFTDLDDEDTVFVISNVSIPNWLSYDNDKKTFSGIPLEENEGTFAISFTVSDNEDEKEIKRDLIVMKGNAPPSISSKPKLTTNEKSLYEYIIIASDEDGDSIEIATEGLPDWFSVDGNRIFGIPGKEDIGKNIFEIKVTDTFHKPIIQKVELEVLNVNDKPIFTSKAENIIVNENELFSYNIRYEDEDGDNLTLLALKIPDWCTLNEDKNVIFGTPGEGDLGKKGFIALRISDPSGDFSMLEFKLDVVLSKEKKDLLDFSRVDYASFSDMDMKDCFSFEELEKKMDDIKSYNLIEEFLKIMALRSDKNSTVYLLNPKDQKVEGNSVKSTSCIKVKYKHSDGGSLSVETKTDYSIDIYKQDYIYALK